MSKTEIKDQLREREVDQISKELNPNIQSFVPKQIPAFNASQSQPHPSLDNGATPSHLVSLQAKQTELSSLLINQQKAVHLPVKEPPVFSGDSFEYRIYSNKRPTSN